MTPAEMDRVARRFLPRIQKIARGYGRQLPASVDVADLAQAGTVGMLSALRSFDPRRGDRVEIYVQSRVRGAILDELRALDPLSRDQRRDARTIQKAARSLEGELGRPAEDAEIADRAGLDAARVREVLDRSSRSVPLPLDAADFEPDRGAVDPLRNVEVEKLRAALVEAVDELPAREKTILSLYYVEELSLKEIGNLLGVTESRVCQIHGAAVKKLRQMLATS
jgi:RNA polymerase sigma factor FliA